MNCNTQPALAKAGVITPAMKQVAAQEQLSEETIRAGVAAGTIVIPANINHRNLVPIGIGRILKTKINANIGNSAVASCPRQELEKLDRALRYGADTVMDLSTGGNINQIRQSIISHSPAPIGTVPMYEVLARCKSVDNLSESFILDVMREQAEQGVDYMTIHAGLLRSQIPAACRRVLRIVSRGGSILAAWMQKFDRENPFYTAFDEILEICRKYDVTLSLGDGMRPGCLADASDEAQFAELAVLGELVERCRAADVQAMVEGPGHIPFHEVAMNMQKEQKLCGDAPFYVLGPVVTDCAPGYDHITSGDRAILAPSSGAALRMLCPRTASFACGGAVCGPAAGGGAGLSAVCGDVRPSIDADTGVPAACRQRPFGQQVLSGTGISFSAGGVSGTGAFGENLSARDPSGGTISGADAFGRGVSGTDISGMAGLGNSVPRPESFQVPFRYLPPGSSARRPQISRNSLPPRVVAPGSMVRS